VIHNLYIYLLEVPESHYLTVLSIQLHTNL
jgi:hypothetical protein